MVTGDQFAALVIALRARAERQRTLQLAEPFFAWLKARHLDKWAVMGQLSYASGATFTRAWAVSGLRKLNTKEARIALWQTGFAADPHG